MENTAPKTRERRIVKDRLSILHQVEDWLELPMVVLGFIWLLLLILEFATDWGARFETIGTAIWVIFIFDFLLKLLIAPRKLRFMQRNWLTIIALVVPAFRVFRAFRAIRALRAARGLRLVRVVSSINRGMKALGSVLGRRGLGYAVALTILVTFGASAGMYAFEREHGLEDYGTALWWTAMVVTTMGSEYWPKTPEGRVLCLFLAIYAFAAFGYVTAALASFFVDRDTKAAEATTSLNAKRMDQIQTELREIKAELRRLAKDDQNPMP